jgi:2-octaprenyl-6-methoxyphenol hydroxylase
VTSPPRTDPAAPRAGTHDIAIVGAGPVGGAFALALADADLDVVSLDARAAGTTMRGDRSLALSHGARLIFERLDVWWRLSATRGAVTPITAIDVSQARGFGVTRIEAAELELTALGYVVSYTALQAAIDAAMAHAGIEVRFNATVAGVTATPTEAHVNLDADGATVAARLAVVADGAGTPVADIARERRPYGQVALIAKLALDRPHGGVAYERFTREGPMALLPEDDRYGLVWTLAPEKAEAMLALSDDAFIAAMATQFGSRMSGFIGVGPRRTFPLSLEYAKRTVATRTAVIGNAAQSLHPIAGQGFNLGVRDAFELAQTIKRTPRDALGGAAMLARFAAARRVDRWAGIGFTHGLTQIFATEAPLVRWPRGAALALLDALPPVKRAFTRAMLFGMH